MKLYNDFKIFDNNNKHTVVSIGMFDSVHLGHQSVLNKVKSISKEYNVESVVITFANSPAIFFQNKSSNEFIFSIEDKIEQLENFEIDHLIILPFDEFIASLYAKVFVEDILIKYLNVSHLVLGYDNHFGKGREGSVNYIHTNFDAKIDAFSVEAVQINAEVVSSSIIKQYLQKGEMLSVFAFLGRNYYLKGEVVKGKQLGRQIGFKTANIQFDMNLFVPSFGVYAVKVILNDKEYLGVCNLGIRPTIIDDNQINVETHLFDFDREIYGSVIRIEFIKKIRDEKKFNSIDELKLQIQTDVESARFVLA